MIYLLILKGVKIGNDGGHRVVAMTSPWIAANNALNG